MGNSHRDDTTAEEYLESTLAEEEALQAREKPPRSRRNRCHHRSIMNDCCPICLRIVKNGRRI